jgi:Calcineurin-like phosphoesterase
MVVFNVDAGVAEREMRAILFVLVAFAHIDGVVDVTERTFIRDAIDELVDQRAKESFPGDLGAQASVSWQWTAHFYQAVSGMEHDIRADFTESVAQGESTTQFVYARLKLRCFELLERLDDQNRVAVLELVERLMHADGVVHPAEKAFRDDLRALLDEDLTRVALPGPLSGQATTILDEARRLPVRRADHPFFAPFEHPYAREPAAFARQAAGDIEIIRRFEAQLDEQRERGEGRLRTARSFREFAGQAPFLDDFVYVYPPEAGVDYELLVIGDLHGCYSCLKAAVLQADFFAKIDAWKADPKGTPYPLLVLLGDYIDRGLFSYDGILRTVLRLALAAPDHVFVLRGNHEHYMDLGGRIVSPVLPAEAIESIAHIAPHELLLAHLHLFDALPSMLAFERILFVHAGIPREDTLAAKPRTLDALNDPSIRLQMAWSDPSDADFVPLELQRTNTRFAFGRIQFRSFMSRIGCSVMVRGHERIVEGLRCVYRGPDMLLSLFSAGGATNEDLPPSSNYREVTPMALTIRHKDGVTRVTPFPIAYERYSHPSYNAFLRPRASMRG